MLLIACWLLQYGHFSLTIPHYQHALRDKGNVKLMLKFKRHITK